jgi:WD40 repeat protein
VAEVDGGTEDNTSHSGVVRTVALEGELLLTGGEDAAVKVWAWTHDGSLKYRRTLTGHTDRVEGVTFDTHTGAFPLRWWGGSLLLYELDAVTVEHRWHDERHGGGCSAVEMTTSSSRITPPRPRLCCYDGVDAGCQRTPGEGFRRGGGRLGFERARAEVTFAC